MASQNTERRDERNDMSFLSERDQRNIRTSASNLTRMFLEDYPGALPDGIIYPDTSARPLFYLFDPALTKAAAQRGVNKPDSFFFKQASKHPSMASIRLLESAYKDDPVTIIRRKMQDLEDLKSRLEQDPSNPNLAQEVKDATTLIHVLGNPEMIQKFRNQANTRAAEILTHLIRKAEKPTLAVFEEFVHEGDTIREIRRAFGDRKVPFYTLIGMDDLDVEKLAPLRVGLPQSQSLQYVDGDDQLTVFDYRYLARDGIGVNKYPTSRINSEILYSPYSSAIREEWLKKKQFVGRLRQDMRKIGQEIAAQI